MKLAFFTERQCRWIDEDLVIENKAFFGLSNSLFDREQAAKDYNFFLDEAVATEEAGFDAYALNEHHGNPYCLGNVVNVEAAILARITKKVKIVVIGNMLPGIKHPLRMAEELAEIDLISGGRLVAGWVRGAGSEQFFNNANPAYNREMFNEAHDFIIDAWTKPGPWRYEGKHFHYRHVNPWALPLQDPYPQQWIPGVLSPETVVWCARHRYPYLGLGSALGPTCDLWDLYADTAAEEGYQAGPENFGYLLPCFVANTEEEAQRIGYGFAFGGGQNAFSRPEHTLPPGYNSKGAIKMLAQAPGGSWLGISKEKLAASRAGAEVDQGPDYAAIKVKLHNSYVRAQSKLQIVVGTPDSIIPKVKDILRVIRPGVFTFFTAQGHTTNDERFENVRLLGEHVLPEIKEYAEGIGLIDAFQRFPGSVPLPQGTKRLPVCDREAMAQVGMSA